MDSELIVDHPKPLAEIVDDTTSTYTLTLKTSNKWGAGTDANIYCQLLGFAGTSPPYHCKESLTHKNKFERNSEDVFQFDNQVRLGDILQVRNSISLLTAILNFNWVRVWHDNAGTGAAWHLAWVQVHDSVDNVTYTFPCRRWFATNEDDGQIMRILDCAKKGIKKATQFGIKFGQGADGTRTAQVYLPTMEYLRDSVAGCLHTDTQWTRDFLGELLGTMFLVAIIDASVAQVVLSRGSHGDFTSSCFASGLAITFGVYLSGNSSGGHINPAVTLVMTLLGRTTWAMLPVYWLAQYIGALLGAGIVFGVYYDAINDFDNGTRQVYGPQATAGIFATYPQDFLHTESGFLDQVIGTAVLTQLIFAVTDPRNHAVPKYLVPLLVGLVVTLVGLSLGFNCGFAINPARDLGPRIFTAMVGYGIDVFSYRGHNWFWVPIAGPHVGAILGTVVYMLFVGLHWPQTFEAAEEAKKKRALAMQAQDDADLPPDLYEEEYDLQRPKVE